MARADRMPHEARLLADCEDALFRLAVVRLEARRAGEMAREANEMVDEWTEGAMDKSYVRVRPRVLRAFGRERRRAGLRLFRGVPFTRMGAVAACVLAVALIGGISALAVSAGARRYLSNLLVDPQEEFTAFELQLRMGDTKPVVPDGFEGDFYPAYIPEGYTLKDAHRGSVYYLTADQEGYLFYDELDENTSMNFDTEDAKVTYMKINGTDAMLVEKNGLSSVIWSFANRFFLVGIRGAPEEAMKVAESLMLID